MGLGFEGLKEMFSRQQTAHLKRQLQKDQLLLDSIKKLGMLMLHKLLLFRYKYRSLQMPSSEMIKWLWRMQLKSKMLC